MAATPCNRVSAFLRNIRREAFNVFESQPHAVEGLFEGTRASQPIVQLALNRERAEGALAFAAGGSFVPPHAPRGTDQRTLDR